MDFRGLAEHSPVDPLVPQLKCRAVAATQERAPATWIASESGKAYDWSPQKTSQEAPMPISRHLLINAAALGTAAALAHAAYPERLIVPFSPGGAVYYIVN